MFVSAEPEGHIAKTVLINCGIGRVFSGITRSSGTYPILAAMPRRKINPS
jgi:hypothetical protein